MWLLNDERLLRSESRASAGEAEPVVAGSPPTADLARRLAEGAGDPRCRVHEQKVTSLGSSGPKLGSMRAVVKQDSEAAPTTVYNEYVASRLGAMFGISVATGVLAEGEQSGSTTTAYASLIANGPGGRLPHVTRYSVEQVAQRYPWECSGMLVFDVLIGNWDRLENVRAELVRPGLGFISGFDHANSLLMSASSLAQVSIDALARGEPIVHSHPFAPFVSRALVAAWIQRVAIMPSVFIRQCCVLGGPLNRVSSIEQLGLAYALERRVGLMSSLCEALMVRGPCQSPGVH